MDTSFARFGYEEGVHGYACAEIIRDIAPDAELFLVRVNGLTTFENAIDWAIRNDIDLISMSMSFFNSSFYDGTGPFGPPMEALAANDVLMVTSSGNYAREHWSGRWLDQDSDGWLDFDGDNQLELSMTSGNRRTVYFTWDEHQRCGESDLDAYIYDDEGNVLGASETVQDDENRRCEPVERVKANIPSNGSYWLRVRANRVVAPYLEVDVFTQNGSIPAAVPGWSIADPGAHREAFTVGAVRAEGYLTADIESFSSWGPVRSGWDKPDIAGPDGLTVNAYGAEGFYGTSAATPAVAAALALVMSREPDLTPKQAGQRLKSWALNDDPLGRQDDPRWGAGKARLPVPEPSFGGCGRGRLWAIVFLPPIAWRRRRSDTSVG
jgi:subtilisin family serine protease